MNTGTPDVKVTINLSLEEMYSGVTKSLNYKRVIPCTSCNLAKECPDCRGKGLVLDEVAEPINIPQGVDEGMMLKFRGKGNRYFETKDFWNVFSKKTDTSKIKSGDLIVQIKAIAHDVFERADADLIYRCDLVKSLIEVTDVNIEFLHLNGEYIKIKIPQDTANGKVFRIKGKGFKNLTDNTLGNLLIVANVTDD